MTRRRKEGPLKLGDKLRDALSTLRYCDQAPPDYSMNLAALEEVEKRLGFLLPDAVIAYLAATDREPEQVEQLTADARDDGLPKRLFAFEHDRRSQLYFCTNREPEDKSSCPVFAWECYGGEQHQWSTMSSFIHSRHDIDPNLEDNIDHRDSKLTLYLPPEPESCDRRVLHKRYGEGTVLEELPAPIPKLIIDFGPPVGKKTILSTYVTVLDSPVSPDPSKGQKSRKRRSRRGERAA